MHNAKTNFKNNKQNCWKKVQTTRRLKQRFRLHSEVTQKRKRKIDSKRREAVRPKINVVRSRRCRVIRHWRKGEIALPYRTTQLRLSVSFNWFFWCVLFWTFLASRTECSRWCLDIIGSKDCTSNKTLGKSLEMNHRNFSTSAGNSRVAVSFYSFTDNQITRLQIRN